MKFTKEQAVKELVRLMTEKGETLNLSERTMNDNLETLIPVLVNDEMEMADFIKIALPIFKSADANVRNDVSHKIKDFMDKQTKTPPTTPPQGNGDKELEDRLAKLEKMYNDSLQKEKLRGIKDNLKNAIKEKGVKDDNWIDLVLSKVTINDSFNVEQEVDSYVDMYNKMKASYTQNLTPDQASGGTDKYISDSIKAASEFAKSQSLAE